MWVGEDGMSFVWDCVACYFGAYPTSPSSPSALRSGAGSTTPSRHAVDLPCCVCANVDGVPLQKSVKIANGFSLYVAILMGVRVHSSCFAYSEAPNGSLPGALELQSSWKCPDQTATFPEKALVRLLAVVGGVGVGVVGSCWLYICMFL